MEADTKKGALVITGTYYGDIVRLISQPRYLHDVPSHALPNFLNCADNLLGLQVVTRMINTIEHLLEMLSNRSSVPLLKVRLMLLLISFPNFDKLYLQVTNRISFYNFYSFMS